jgi:hypothetical protein
MPEQNDFREAARNALFEAIPGAVSELQKHNGPSQAEGLKKLAEAYAWLIHSNQAH